MTAPTPGIDGFRTPRATCLLAPNPSPMTLDGTNTWLIAEPGSSSVVIVDPGPDDEDLLSAEEEAAAEGGDADVLEDTPDFLQETPEHDRLWFEQKPPRDFDFD